MSRDPVIAAALDAAGEAGRKAMALPGCCLEGTGCELPPCHCSRVAAAADVAAFLRAIPTGLPTDDSPSPFRISSIAVGAEWIDAIERAGGGDG